MRYDCAWAHLRIRENQYIRASLFRYLKVSLFKNIENLTIFANSSLIS